MIGSGTILLRHACVIGLLAIAALPATAANVIVRTGTPTGYLGFGNGVYTLLASWTQSAGNTYSSATITANICSTNGAATSATWYLTTSIGSGTTVANQVATGAVPSVTAACPQGSNVTLATGLTLAPATYFLVISNQSANFAWSYVSGGAAEALGTGVTSNPDEYSVVTPQPYPPSDLNFANATAGGSSKVFLYSVTGNAGTPPPSTGVPTLSTWAFSGTILLLIGSGLFLMSKFRTRE